MDNGVMMQYFSWFLPADGSLWKELAHRAGEMAAQGFTAVWIPPCSKASGGMHDRGYGVYDLFDLGEFPAKGCIATKYGTKRELLEAIDAAQVAGLQVYADIVFNHMDGADETERVRVQEVEWGDRNREIGGETEISAWTKFTFPARAGQYSQTIWNWECFDSLSYNEETQSRDHLYRLKRKQFETDVSHEHRNFDYLFANDLDIGEPRVREELLKWGEWFLGETGVDGFRLDACKHIRAGWYPEWLGRMRAHAGRELFTVGEYWSGNIDELRRYEETTGGIMSLFDVPLHNRFVEASREGSGYDLRTTLDRTLMRESSARAVTFVENHDTQPGCSLEPHVEPWFKPLAYAIILLRQEGYPCVFHGDYYGSRYENPKTKQPAELYTHRFLIDRFMKARREHGFGAQEDYFDHPNTIGWTRLGDAEHPGSLAVLMTNGSEGRKWMNVYRPHAAYQDATGHFSHRVVANGDGWAEFVCPVGSVSVWVQE